MIPQETIIIKKTRFNSVAKDAKPNLRILKNYDVTNQSNSNGTIENFLGLFHDKFNSLTKILKKRTNLNPKLISRLSKVASKSEVDLIGMVRKKWITKNNHLALIIEDLEANCIAIVSKDDLKMFELAQTIMLDDVMGFKCVKLSNEMVIVKEFFWPDLEEHSMKEAENDLDAIIISDLHVGSKLFMEKEFQKFLNWLNGDTESEKEKQRIGRIKYMIIVGDNIDGIGVYPGQFEELEIKDLYKQYEKLEELLLQVPEYIEMIMIPGQHDAVRRADPQPAIPEKFLPKLSMRKNFHLLGSPSWFEIEGLKAVIYHGACLHDLYSVINHLSPLEPHKAIIELLKRRDLMTSYGIRQPYVPEKKDFMLIREEPDLYFGGDMHHTGYGKYKGCTIINSATWQERTDYQVSQGHIPTPGIAIQLELKSRKITENSFI
ncbi:MAG: metallophosphoesterase [Candidatus Diapherotrites archaeon]